MKDTTVAPSHQLPAFEVYHQERLMPLIEKLSWLALVVLLAFLPWDYLSDSHLRNLAVVFRVLSIIPLSLVGFAARYRWFGDHFVTAVLLLSLLSFGLLNLNFVLLEERSPYVFSVLFYFNLGFLMLAPLVTNAHIVANFVVPPLLVYVTYWAFGRLAEYLLPFTLLGLPVLVFLNVCVWYARRTAQHTYELYRLNQELATTDSLTQLNNRRAWEQQSRRLLNKARREGSGFALLLLDIDFFKEVNDTHGHPVGDVVLRELATCLRAMLREYDVLGRFGGEEFVLTVTHLNRAQVLALAERLRRTVEQRTMTAGTLSLSITISIGVALLEDADLSLDTLLVRSDEALYRAKQTGRNRVCVWGTEEPLAA